MNPLDVPTTMDTATQRHVGFPKFLRPASEKTCAVIFFSLVHRTTSHGGCGVSASSWFCWSSEPESEGCRDWLVRKAGERTRGDAEGEGDRRAENLRSNGFSGECRECEACEAKEAGTLLVGEESMDP